MIDNTWLKSADEFGRRLIDNADDVVAQELTYLFDENNVDKNKLIIPILLDGAEMPPSHALPEKFAKLNSFKSFKIAYGNDIFYTNEMNFLSDKAVSYTHLTLPTICSV